MIPRSSVHNLQSFACQFNTGKLVTKVFKKSFSDGGGGEMPPLATPLLLGSGTAPLGLGTALLEHTYFPERDGTIPENATFSDYFTGWDVKNNALLDYPLN